MESIKRMPTQKSPTEIQHNLRNGLQITIKSLELGSWVDGPSKLRVHIRNGGNRTVPINPNSFYLIDRNGFAQTPVRQGSDHRFLYPGGSVDLLLRFEISYLEISQLAIVEGTLDTSNAFIADMSQVISNIAEERKLSSDGLMPWERDMN